MANELLDICDENNAVVGQAFRDEAHKQGLWHRTTHVWIYNQNGEILLQLRAKNKDFFPNMWDLAVAGHVSTGENSLQTAERETEEELGIKINPADLEFIEIRKASYLHKLGYENVFHSVYLLKSNINTNNLRLQSEEVSDTHFIPLKTLEKDLIQNPQQYTPRGDYWQTIINEIKKRVQ